MTHGLGAVRDGIRRLYDNQVQLQQRYLDRNDVTGTDARRAGRQLRWHGAVLVGDLLPPDQHR